MARKSLMALWVKRVTRGVKTIARVTTKRAVRKVIHATQAKARPTQATAGDWLAGLAIGPTGALRYRLYRPAGVKPGETVPLLVMLHGCRQDAQSFADSTRMNRIASRQRCLVLYPQQDRMVNAQACWNWYDTKSGAAYSEAALIMAAVDQVCLQYPADAERIAVAGLSAGASMAALLAWRYSDRFKAVIMHSGVALGSADSARTALAAMRGRRASMPAPTRLDIPHDLPPLLVLQGKADHIVAAVNGPTSATRWAEAGHAHAGPARIVERRGRYPMTVSEFKEGKRSVVTLVSIEQLGHAWSGGKAGLPFSDAKGPDASRMLWAFAAKQFGRCSAPLPLRA